MIATMRRSLLCSLSLLALLAATAAPGEAQHRRGQLFFAPVMNTFLTTVNTGDLSGDDFGVSYEFGLFPVIGLSGTNATLGTAIFVQAVMGPVATDRSVAVNRDLTAGAAYVFVLTRVTGSGGISVGVSNSMDGWAVRCTDSSCSAVFDQYDIQRFGLSFTAAPTSVVPEPASLLLLGSGLAGLGAAARRRRKRAEG
jgi:hypothetical protein